MIDDPGRHVLPIPTNGVDNRGGFDPVATGTVFRVSYRLIPTLSQVPKGGVLATKEAMVPIAPAPGDTGMTADHYRNRMLAAVLAFLALAAIWAARAGETGFGILCALWFILVAIAPAWPSFGRRTRAWCFSGYLAFLALAAAGAMRGNAPEFAIMFVLFFIISVIGALVVRRRKWLPKRDVKSPQTMTILLAVPMAVAGGAMWFHEMDVALVAVATIVGMSFSLFAVAPDRPHDRPPSV